MIKRRRKIKKNRRRRRKRKRRNNKCKILEKSKGGAKISLYCETFEKLDKKM